MDETTARNQEEGQEDAFVDRRRFLLDETGDVVRNETAPAEPPAVTKQAPADAGAGTSVSGQETRKASAEFEAMLDELEGRSGGEDLPPTGGEGPPELDVWSYLTYSFNVLLQQAYVYMGLVTNPAAKKITKDLPQAKAAIDAMSGIAQALKPRLTGQELKAVQQALQQLQLNYVSQSRIVG
jgi:hypothetical protein